MIETTTFPATRFLLFQRCKFPLWASITFIITAEVIAAIAIRKNLFFTSLMLIAPQDWILEWQAGGPFSLPF